MFLKTRFNLNNSFNLIIVENDVRHVRILKIILLAMVRFQFEVPA
jgi:hypothetical protein